MPQRRDHKRVLIYSHDSFGLGHLRRCRAIAHSLVEADSSVSVLILSGSPIIGSFDFRSRVDFVRIPGVIKLRNGEYVSLSLHIDIEETLAMRSSIIHHTAAIFDPDLLIVDKEPLGLRGEVRPTLDLLHGAPASGTGGQYRNEVEAQLGMTLAGFGARLSADWREGTYVEGAPGSPIPKPTPDTPSGPASSPRPPATAPAIARSCARPGTRAAP